MKSEQTARIMLEDRVRRVNLIKYNFCTVSIFSAGQMNKCDLFAHFDDAPAIISEISATENFVRLKISSHLTYSVF